MPHRQHTCTAAITCALVNPLTCINGGYELQVLDVSSARPVAGHQVQTLLKLVLSEVSDATEFMRQARQLSADSDAALLVRTDGKLQALQHAAQVRSVCDSK
jgi:hypothetical protein